MRAPQYGHSKGKRRGSQTALPPQPRLWRAVGLRGPNEPLPMGRIRYQPRKDVQYDDGSYGVAVSMSLWHKSAKWDDGVKVGGEGPTASKRYAVVKTRPQVRG